MTMQTGATAAAARAQQELYAYWASLKDGRRLPARASIRPEDLKRFLPTISLIDVHAQSGDYRLRLAGTGLFNIYGREITGRTLGEAFSPPIADYWRSELVKVVEDRVPVVGLHNLAWRGTAHLSMLWMRLPLASNGEDVDMILGYDALVGAVSEQSVTGIRAA
jgi:hypothetical protein